MLRKKIICHVRQVKLSRKGHIPSSSRKKRDSIVNMLARCTLLKACVLSGAEDIAEPILPLYERLFHEKT